MPMWVEWYATRWSGALTKGNRMPMQVRQRVAYAICGGGLTAPIFRDIV